MRKMNKVFKTCVTQQLQLFMFFGCYLWANNLGKQNNWGLNNCGHLLTRGKGVQEKFTLTIYIMQETYGTAFLQ